MTQPTTSNTELREKIRFALASSLSAPTGSSKRMEPISRFKKIEREQQVDRVEALVKSQISEIHKAYGGCTKCYGKAYATVNDRWSGSDTDQDIGSSGGTFSGGDSFAMKFCSCDRGKQLSRLVAQAVTEGRRTGYAKGVEILAWRIDCSTMISELSGWRNCVEMAKEQAMSLRDAQLNPQKPGEEEV